MINGWKKKREWLQHNRNESEPSLGGHVLNCLTLFKVDFQLSSLTSPNPFSMPQESLAFSERCEADSTSYRTGSIDWLGTVVSTRTKEHTCWNGPVDNSRMVNKTHQIDITRKVFHDRRMKATIEQSLHHVEMRLYHNRWVSTFSQEKKQTNKQPTNKKAAISQLHALRLKKWNYFSSSETEHDGVEKEMSSALRNHSFQIRGLSATIYGSKIHASTERRHLVYCRIL